MITDLFEADVEVICTSKRSFVTWVKFIGWFLCSKMLLLVYWYSNRPLIFLQLCT